MTDAELKETVASILKDDDTTCDKVRIKAKHGYVYLKGEVEYPSQRDCIGKSLMKHHIRGLRGVCNLITVKSHNKSAISQ